jgi:hypothetical protein
MDAYEKPQNNVAVALNYSKCGAFQIVAPSYQILQNQYSRRSFDRSFLLLASNWRFSCGYDYN